MKLTTADLKNLISNWFSKCDLSKEFTGDCDTYEQEDLDRHAGYFNLPKGSTAEEIANHKLKLFVDGNKWARGEKGRIKEEVYEYSWFHIEGNDFKFYPDHDHLYEYDEQLAKDLHNNKILVKCWHRVFYPKNDLADNYRLEVLTDPDDEKVVVWQVITD